jgi:hypothetical protein
VSLQELVRGVPRCTVQELGSSTGNLSYDSNFVSVRN